MHNKRLVLQALNFLLKKQLLAGVLKNADVNFQKTHDNRSHRLTGEYMRNTQKYLIKNSPTSHFMLRGALFARDFLTIT